MEATWQLAVSAASGHHAVRCWHGLPGPAWTDLYGGGGGYQPCAKSADGECNHYFGAVVWSSGSPSLGCHVPLPPSKQWDVKPFQTEGSVENSIFGGDHGLISPKRDVSGNAGNDVIPASSSFIQLHVSKKIGQRSNTSVLLKLKHDPHAREMSVGKMMWVRREAMGGSSVVKQFRRSCGACCNQDWSEGNFWPLFF